MESIISCHQRKKLELGYKPQKKQSIRNGKLIDRGRKERKQR